ncbi:MAG TPA: glycosyltransferase [Thermoanaerobaculia bacterium]|nr:glycosyltransferase [Thermoanaerobaculia bacterium]
MPSRGTSPNGADRPATGLLGGDPPGRDLLADARRLTRKLARRVRGIERRVVRLEPAGRPRGRILFSYVLDPLLEPREAPVDRTHTHFWESRQMAWALVDAGWAVDAVHWTNHRFVPELAYDAVLDVRTNLERWVGRLPSSTLRLFHCDTAHWSFNNRAEKQRLDELAERRGIVLAPHREMPPNRGIELADHGTYLGNEFTRSTYREWGTPMTRIPVSVPCTYDWQQGKDFEAARRRFLWFGSGGLVHKGLDLVLEAFAEMPDLELVVAGPIRRERDFARAFRHELYELPNVETVDWVDVASARFVEICRGSVGLVYPSCSEGGGSSALTCLHAGLIPVLTREASVDLDPAWGVELETASVEEIQARVRELAERPAGELEEMARGAWEWVRAHHTREVFAEAWRRFTEELTGGRLRGAVTFDRNLE